MWGSAVFPTSQLSILMKSGSSPMQYLTQNVRKNPMIEDKELIRCEQHYFFVCLFFFFLRIHMPKNKVQRQRKGEGCFYMKVKYSEQCLDNVGPLEQKISPIC